MQKWEYLFVVAEYENKDWRVKFINGKEVENWKNGIILFDYANKIGDEGWELVSAPYTSDPVFVTPHLIFKRPKS